MNEEFEKYRKKKWALLQNEDKTYPFIPKKIDIKIKEIEFYYKKHPFRMIHSFEILKKEKPKKINKRSMVGLKRFLDFPINKEFVKKLSHEEKIEHLVRKCPGWFAEDEIKFLIDIAKSYSKIADNYVELGSFLGKSLNSLSIGFENSKVKITCIDIWQDPSAPSIFKLTGDILFAMHFDQFLKWTYWFKDNLNIIRWNSWKASEFFENQSIDIIFLDAAHDFENVFRDIVSWLPKLKKNGIIIGHDYVDSHPGVKLAVKKVFGKNFDRGPGGIWYKIM